MGLVCVVGESMARLSRLRYSASEEGEHTQRCVAGRRSLSNRDSA